MRLAGPHCFIVPMREGDRLLPGITVQDMGLKEGERSRSGSEGGKTTGEKNEDKKRDSQKRRMGRWVEQVMETDRVGKGILCDKQTEKKKESKSQLGSKRRYRKHQSIGNTFVSQTTSKEGVLPIGQE